MKRGAFGAISLLFLTACTDDHFDVKTWGSGDKTIWGNIENDPNLSEFVGLLKRTKVMKDENDKSATLTAAELLNRSQSFSMWIPANGTFNAKLWNDTLDAAQRYRTQGTPAALKKAQAIEYAVWRQVVSNHIARFNYESVPGSGEVRLLNAKRSTYDGKKFNGIALGTTTYNASNGTVHVLQGFSPFAENLYDYLSTQKSISSLNNYLKDPSVETETFSENLSVPGAMNEEGKMIYIDSVYIRTNKLLDATGALIRNEDSTYVAFYPTNTAWEEALTKIGKIYQYGSTYAYDWNGAGFANNSSNNKNLKLNTALTSDPTKTLADSLREYNVRQDIARNLFFSTYRFENINKSDSASLINYVMHADSLVTTFGTVFYNPAAKSGTPNANINPALKGLTPYRASNGYIFNLDRFDFDPAYSLVSRSELSIGLGAAFHVATSSNTLKSTGSNILLTENNYNNYRIKTDADGKPVLDGSGNPVYVGVQGSVSNKSYQRFEINNEDVKMTIDFRLPPVYSAAYTIKVVLLPTKINLDHIVEGEPEEIVKFTADIVDDEDKIVRGTTVTIDQAAGDFDPDKVNEVTLWKNYQFPKCYASLPDGRVSFPRLRLTLPPKPRLSPMRCKALNIVKIIVEPYRGQ